MGALTRDFAPGPHWGHSPQTCNRLALPRLPNSKLIFWPFHCDRFKHMYNRPTPLQQTPLSVDIVAAVIIEMSTGANTYYAQIYVSQNSLHRK